MTLYRRLTLVAEAGTIVKAFYPVFPPDRDAAGCSPGSRPTRPVGAGERLMEAPRFELGSADAARRRLQV